MGNPHTGAIGRFETDEDARAAGYTLPLTDAQAAELFPFSREERKRLFAELVDQGNADTWTDTFRLSDEKADKAEDLRLAAKKARDARSLEERIAESVRVLAAAGEAVKEPSR